MHGLLLSPYLIMNTLILPIAELKPALQGLGKVINLKASLPVLHHVKIERTTDGWIALTATDLDRFVTMRLEHPSDGNPVTTLVPYDQLQQIVKGASKTESIIIEPTPQVTVIRFSLADNAGESKVKPIPVEEFPAIPRIPGEPIVVPSEARRAILEAFECSSSDQSRHVLNGAFLDNTAPKASYIVGTDGRHLYSANSFQLPLKHSPIIPVHKFLGWREFNNDGEWRMRVDDRFLQLSSRRWRYITKTIDGKYPDWKMVIPTEEPKSHLRFDTEMRDTIIRRVEGLSNHDEQYHSIGLEVKNHSLQFLVKKDAQEPWLSIPEPNAKAKGPDVVVFLDRRYLIKALSYGLSSVSIIDPLSPIRFHNDGGKQLIVMPVRTRDAETPAQPPTRPIPQPSQRIQPPTERRLMIHQTTPEPTPSNTGKSTVEEALDLTLQIRDKFNDGFTMLRDLSGKLKAIQRDQKTNAKEFNGLRSTLRSLQSMKL